VIVITSEELFAERMLTVYSIEAKYWWPQIGTCLRGGNTCDTAATNIGRDILRQLMEKTRLML